MLRQLRARQQAVASNAFWRPTQTDDFRVIVWKGIDQQEQKDGPAFPVITGWDAETGVPFRMQLYRHIEWQLQDRGQWPVPPGTLVSIFFTGKGTASNQQETYQFHVDFHQPDELGELGPRGQQQLAALIDMARAGIVERVREAASDGADKTPRVKREGEASK